MTQTEPAGEDVQAPAKRAKLERVKGIAPIKPQYLVADSQRSPKAEITADQCAVEDERAEGMGLERLNNPSSNGGPNQKRKKGPKQRGQNKNRNLTQQRETVRYCDRPRETDESGKSTGVCARGASCKFEHDIEKYIASKPVDLDGTCPVFEALGYCPAGIKCRWLSSHFADGKVVEDAAKKEEASKTNFEVNRVSPQIQHDLQRKHYDMSPSEKYIKWLNEQGGGSLEEEDDNGDKVDKKEYYADFTEGILRPTEKRKLNYHRAKVLSPLTTVGNLPYRRLMKTLGTDVTFSEMALSLPLIQGQKSEWALARAHSSELPNFVAQIAASKPWQAVKAVQVISQLAPSTGEINLNCGCPIDLLYRQGAGSALLDNPAKIIRMTRGMNAMSGEIPITIKIRTGVKDGHPTAKNLVRRLVEDEQVGCITLHGRSRAQRYTREADWQYIREVADIVKETRQDKVVQPWIVGNGDVYSFEDWNEHIEQQGVDTCMVARGALIKPWIFEEIDAQQYLDKRSSERLEYLRQYTHYGLEHWGSDEYGVNQTRRFLCEWMSFTHRYIPVGILEYLPPKLNDRPPPWQGRDELETLLASSNYQDWIKVSEMFLGPVAPTFEFEPKHKSNAYSTPVTQAAPEPAAVEA